MPSRKSQSNSGPYNQERPWRERCASKWEKKKTLSGARDKGSSKKTTRPHARSQVGKELTAEECIVSIGHFFQDVEDPRVNRQRRHLLMDIIIIALCAVICRAETWKDIQVWGESRIEWLKQFLELPNGIPSRDTFRRVISRLDPEVFQACFRKWIATLSRATGGQIIALDGKTLRRSMDSASDLKALHVVSAWASEQHLVLGQVAVDEKSNEITAIPRLLELLEINGALITIDAMGCQRQIAEQIVDQGADYCLAAKGNQETMYDEIRLVFDEYFNDPASDLEDGDYYEQFEKGHGRDERRYYYTMPIPKKLKRTSEWPHAKSIGMAMTVRDGAEESRYYVLSIPSDAQRFAQATRLHWGIENSLHWVLDVTFNEDQSRIRKDNGAEIIGWLRRFAISLLKNEPSVKDTVRAKSVRAAYNVEYLERVLMASVSSEI